MEGFIEGLGIASLAILAIIGAIAGLIAGWIAGRRRVAYVLLGILGAVALPFVLAALGVTALAAGGVLILILVAAVGAVIVLALGRWFMRNV